MKIVCVCVCVFMCLLAVRVRHWRVCSILCAMHALALICSWFFLCFFAFFLACSSPLCKHTVYDVLCVWLCMCVFMCICVCVCGCSVLPAIRERLGDAKDNVREKTQVLVQQIMQDSVTSPQVCFFPPAWPFVLTLIHPCSAHSGLP